MNADKWLEINLVGLVVLGGLAFGARELIDLNAALARLQTTVSSASGQVNAIAREVPDVAAADERKFEQSLSLISNRNAAIYAPTGAQSIDEGAYVPVGGIDQWVRILGESGHNPVILFLHGGPGAVTTPWAYAYLRPWEQYFTVVQWDQRGAGRTLGRSGPSIAATMTVQRLVQDGIALSEYLRGHLHKRRIILVGDGWGALLGALMAKQRPDLFSAFVSTAAPPYQLGVSGQQLSDQRRRICEGADTERFLDDEIGLALTAPGYTIHDYDEWRDGQALSERTLGRAEASLKPQQLAGTFSIPVFVFQGAQDCTSPAALAKHYIDSIKAPVKAFVAIPGAGHFAVFTHSDEFLVQLRQRVRPLAMAVD